MAVLTLLTVLCALASVCAQPVPRPGPVAAGGGGGVAAGGGPGGAAAGGGGGATTGGGPGGAGGPFPRVAQQGQGGSLGGGELGDLYAHLEAELKGQGSGYMGGDMNSDDDEGHLSGDDAEGLMHIYAFSIDNSTFNLLYVLTVKHLPEQSPPTNATITDSQNNTVLFIPATWRETTGQPGFKMGGDDMMNCTGGMCYSYAAAGYWPSVNPTLVDLVTRIVADPESYRGHVALPSGEDVSGEFELGM